jgi:ubiquinone/menaquinone biosynthesis C-methylase UbiE
MTSWYARRIYPHLMDAVLRNEGLHRIEALRSAYGSVLEVGFGTGLNLPYYPPSIARLTTLDVARMLPERVERRIMEVAFEVHQAITKTGALFPFADGQFDCVVTTWTLCSVEEAGTFLGEIQRVLKIDGDYLFLEHGEAIDPHTALWQHRFNWASRHFANGCRLDRPIRELIEQSGFGMTHFRQFAGSSTIGLASHLYLGIAKKQACLAIANPCELN